MIVKPETLIGWHRKGFKLFWKWKSRVGRPPLPGQGCAVVSAIWRTSANVKGTAA